VVYSAQLVQEKRLYYWDKRVNVTYGDELRQGSGGISEIRFGDGTLIRSFYVARIMPIGIEGGVRTIQIKELMSAIFELGDDRSRFRLPGGTLIEGNRSHFTIDRRDDSFVVKNSGPEVLKLDGLPREAGVSELPPGYKIIVPVLPPLDRGPTGTIREDILSGLRVQAGDGVSLVHSPVGIILGGTGPGDGLADVGGARILVVYGFQLHLARVPRSPQPASGETTAAPGQAATAQEGGTHLPPKAPAGSAPQPKPPEPAQGQPPPKRSEGEDEGPPPPSDDPPAKSDGKKG
jgi:hypothetical protein